MTRIFVSYAHSNDTHRQRVGSFAKFLREQGLEVVIDTDVKSPAGPPEQWPRWMKNQIDSADWVLLFIDETYRRRFDGHEDPDKGHGVTWEGCIITHELYRSKTVNRKFIPVLADGTDLNLVPTEIFGATCYRIPSQQQKLAQAVLKYRMKVESNHTFSDRKRTNESVDSAERNLLDAAAWRSDVRSLTENRSDQKSPMKARKLRVFLSYSHKDEKELNRLNTHLAELRRSNLIETWTDRDIRAGSNWNAEIRRELDEADIILLLVSPDFAASDFCRLVEAKRAIERDRKGTALVIPVALKPVAKFPPELLHLQGVPRDLKPITKRRRLDDGLIEAVQLITVAVESFAEKSRHVGASGDSPGQTSFEERHRKAIEAAADEFCSIINAGISHVIQAQILSTLRVPNTSPEELRTATLLLLDGQTPEPGFYSNVMSDLSGLARNPQTPQQDAKAIEQVQMLLTRRLFPRPVLTKLVTEFKAKHSAVIGAVANHIGAEVAAKSAHGLEPGFVPSKEDGTHGVAGHGLLKFVAAPFGKPTPEEDVTQILKELASQIELDLDQPDDLGDALEARIKYWAGRINRKVNGKAREWWKATRPLDDSSELSATVFYCVIRRPSGAKRDKLHSLLQMVREHAPALLFFELNPLADSRDDEDTALEFVSRLFNHGKEET